MIHVCVCHQGIKNMAIMNEVFVQLTFHRPKNNYSGGHLVKVRFLYYGMISFDYLQTLIAVLISILNLHQHSTVLH